MYWNTSSDTTPITLSPLLKYTIIALLIATLVLGVSPTDSQPPPVGSGDGTLKAPLSPRGLSTKPECRETPHPIMHLVRGPLLNG